MKLKVISMFHFVLLTLGPLTLLNVLSQNFAFYWMASWNPKAVLLKSMVRRSPAPALEVNSKGYLNLPSTYKSEF